MPADEGADALRVGTSVHRELERLWSGEPAQPSGDPRVDAMIDAYQHAWASSERYETIGVEVPFSVPLVNPDTGAPSQSWELTGTIDALARDAQGRVWVVEHKTTSEDISIGSIYWRRLAIDPQCSVYVHAARSLGHDCAGVLYDVVRKPMHRRGLATPESERKYTKAGALYATQRLADEPDEEWFERMRAAMLAEPEKYFRRGIVVRTAEDDEDAARDRWQAAKSILDARRLARWPRNANACVRYGRTCEFFDVCTNVVPVERLVKK